MLARKNTQFWDNISGGLAVTVISVPGNLAFGIVVYGLLGPEFESHALSAGFISVLAVSLISFLFSSLPGMISGPGALSAIVLGAGLKECAATINLADTALSMPEIMFLTAAFTMISAGGIQCIFGFLRLGRIIRYLPYPVLSGLLTGSGLVIVSGLIQPMLDAPFYFQLLTVFSFAVMFLGPCIISKISGALQALVLGSIIYLIGTLFQIDMGECLPPLKFDVAAFAVSEQGIRAFFSLFSNKSFALNFLGGSFSLALFATICSLIALAGVERLKGRRADGNREILIQGVANICCGFTGGIPVEANLGRTKTALQAGGKGRSAILWMTGITIFILFAAPQSTSYLSRAVFSGIVMGIGISLIDPWLVKGCRQLIRASGQTKELISNLGIAILVACVSLCVNLVAAVFIGVGIAVLMYLRQSSATVIRRVVNGKNFRSSRQRNEAESDALNIHGGKIHLLELEGGLFFGSAEAVRNCVRHLQNMGGRYLVFDFKRVTYIDLTASVVLQDLFNGLHKAGVHLSLSYITNESEIMQRLRDQDHTGVLDAIDCFQTSKEAFEHMEDTVLQDNTTDRYASDPNVNQMLGLDKFPIEISCMLIDYLQRETYRSGEIICGQGETADAVYFVYSGLAAMFVQKGSRDIRLASFGKGIFFGETALMGEPVYPATVSALSDVVVYRLNTASFGNIQKNYPELSQAIFTVVSKSLAQRLYQSYTCIAELEGGA
jgi:SulP family sulfate permease